MQLQPNRLNTASPFTSPSSSPGATPVSSDIDWSTGSEWSLSASTPSTSRAPTPALLAARATPQLPASITQEQFQAILGIVAQLAANPATHTPAPSSSQQVPPPPSFDAPTSRPTSPETSTRKRIPRPPNAFMLFRSWLIKQGFIPKDVEQRQQNISRVAGQCWNSLKEHQKAIWYEKARNVKDQHMLAHPKYKYSPERKTLRRKGPEETGAPAAEGEEYIRWIRETFTGIKGASVPPPRPRKPKSRRGVERDSTAPPPSHTHSLSLPLTPYHMASPALPSAPPQHTEDIKEDFLARYNALMQGERKDDDATPKALTFGNIALPTDMKDTVASSPSTIAMGASIDVEFGLVPSLSAGSLQLGNTSRPATPTETDVRPWDAIFSVSDSLIGAGSGVDGHDSPTRQDPNSVYAYSDFSSFDYFTNAFPST